MAVFDHGKGGVTHGSTAMSKCQTWAINRSLDRSHLRSQAVRRRFQTNPARTPSIMQSSRVQPVDENKGTQRQMRADRDVTENTRFAPASKPERVVGRHPLRRRA